MRPRTALLSVYLLITAPTSGQVSSPVVGTELMAYWSLDETSGPTVADLGPYHNTGIVYGTTSVQGRVNLGRAFNGSGDYILVNNPPNWVLDFAPDQSFTISVWFKTTSLSIGEFLRRGLAPQPGYLLRIDSGHVRGVIGNRGDASPPNALIQITSSAKYNDGFWHHALLIRDRSRGYLYLYVDNQLAAAPVADTFPYPLAAPSGLYIGRWGNYVYPTYYDGTLDEIAIFGSARHPDAQNPLLLVHPNTLVFPTTIVGEKSEDSVFVFNADMFLPLRVQSAMSTAGPFVALPPFPDILPLRSAYLKVQYTPITPGLDSAILSLTSTDPIRPTVSIAMHGRGVGLTTEPRIAWIRDVPNDAGRVVRIVWHRSILDIPQGPSGISDYTIWRRVDGFSYGLSPTRQGDLAQGNPGQSVAINGALWDYIVSVPAAGFQQYSCLAPTLADSSGLYGIVWSVFMVSARSYDGRTFFSEPDSGYSTTGSPYQPTTIDIPGSIPRSGSPTLHQNYPNPFNPVTTIRFDLPVTESVVVTIVDLLGREITRLYDDRCPPGTHFLTWDASGFGSSVYLVRLQAGSTVITKKMTVLK
jgi:hypothetical protein